jgi:hypothetical protein
MSFVFLYKLKGKRVSFLVLNILRNFLLFYIWYGTVYCMAQCVIWHGVLYDTVYCVAQFIVWHSVLNGTVYCVALCIVWHNVLYGTVY